MSAGLVKSYFVLLVLGKIGFTSPIAQNFLYSTVIYFNRVETLILNYGSLNNTHTCTCTRIAFHQYPTFYSFASMKSNFYGTQFYHTFSYIVVVVLWFNNFSHLANIFIVSSDVVVAIAYFNAFFSICVSAFSFRFLNTDGLWLDHHGYYGWHCYYVIWLPLFVISRICM